MPCCPNLNSCIWGEGGEVAFQYSSTIPTHISMKMNVCKIDETEFKITCVIGYFIYVLYPHKTSLANPVFTLIEYSMDSPVW